MQPWLRRVAVATVGLAVVLTGAAQAWVYATTSGDRYPAAAAKLPERPVAIVLGAGVRADGEPSGVLAGRLDLAYELYSAGQVEAILVSGDNSAEHYNETDTMRDYLIEAGVADGHVVGDHAGFRTWDSCVRAREVFGVEEALVVSQSFHVPRAVALCRSAGIDAAGVGHSSFDDRPTGTVQGYVREVPASILALGNAMFQPEPTVLGPYEPGIDEALESNAGVEGTEN